MVERGAGLAAWRADPTAVGASPEEVRVLAAHGVRTVLDLAQFDLAHAAAWAAQVEHPATGWCALAVSDPTAAASLARDLGLPDATALGTWPPFRRALDRLAALLGPAPDGGHAARTLALLLRLRAAEEARPLAVVSSFGAEAAVLLDLVAEVDPAWPVLLVDTGRLFPATHEHLRVLVALLGLRDVARVTPDAALLGRLDPTGDLYARDPDRCCAARKVGPLAKALAPFRGWISGRKRYQAATRRLLPRFEWDQAGRLKVNPLADWPAGAVAERAAARGLPAHPLVAEGYASIGCTTCTTPVRPGEPPRAGRWRGHGKVECGLHAATG